MRSRKFLKLGVGILFASISATAGAEGLGAYVGAGVGVPVVAYGSSNLGHKVFGGAKVHEFPIKNAGAIELAIQGEYVDFGSSNYWFTSVSSTSMGVDAIGTWVIPKKWAGWADNKLAVVVKLGGNIVTEKWNSGSSYTYTGLARGVGAEYRVIPAVGVRLMHEQYPSGYSLISASGVFHF